MRDMFDDFMDELRRRQAEQRPQSGEPGAGKGDGDDGNGGPGNGEGGGNRDGGGRDGGNGPNGHDDNGDRDDEPPRRTVPIGRFGGARRGNYDNFDYSGFRPRRRTVAIIAIVAVIVIVIALFTSLIGFITDAIWFQSVGFASVFWTRVVAIVTYFVIGVVIGGAFLWLNVWLAGRLGPLGPRSRFSLDETFGRVFEDPYGRRPTRSRPDTIDVSGIARPIAIGLAIVAAFVALTLGGMLAAGWETIQLWLHRVPFGVNDPTFNKDIGFFVFELPFFRLLQSFATSLVLVALALAGIRYLIAVLSGTPMRTTARLHLGILAGLLLLSIAAGYQLDKLELVFGDHSVFAGANYADANARFVALDALTVIAAFAGAFLVFFAYSRSAIPLGLTVLVWFLALVILSGLFPFAVQRLVVDPNTQNQEAPYAQRSIQMTRLAFGLDKWQVQPPYSPASTVTQQALTAESATIGNVRLWDIYPLEQSFDQNQAIRPYYWFPDVDTDRYKLGSDVRQVMLSARLFNPTQYAAQSSSGVSWVNQHINYTHGLGLAMAPVRDVGGGGQPNLVVRDLPPSNNSGAPNITQPRIYFSDQASDYVIVGTNSKEFDLPQSGGGETTTRWSGTTGIRIDNALIRLLFSLRFGDFNLLISDQITQQSQILFRRSIVERAQAIAPFLRFDKDPYLVVRDDGSLAYMLDGYTVTDRFPSSQPYDPGTDPNATGLAGDPFNYIRNSVKIVMNAYDGTMTFYVADPTDPLIQAWQGVFPGLFKSLDQMPADLKAHIRYPEDMFDAQTTQFERYHVTDAVPFQQNSDVWSVPSAPDSLNSSPIQLGMEAYYVQMRLPNDPNPEFLLLSPLTPKSRPNMISWVAARNDPGHYGQVVVFNFPSDTTTFGPVQLQGLIRQNPDISQQITLWDQAGSRVIMGNLLVIPLQDTLVYIEPVYLEAQGTALPQFERVVVATPTQVVWGTSLQDALNQILAGKGATGPGGGGQTPGPSPSPGPSLTPSPSPSVTPGPTGSQAPSTIQQIVDQLNMHEKLAEQAAAKGDWVTFGQEMQKVRDLSAQLQQLVGTPAPS